MAAQTRDQEQRRRRRRRLVRGLMLGGAAIGVPALLNTLVSRRAQRLPPRRWGSGDRFAWKHGEVVYQTLGEGRPLVLLHSFGPGHSGAEWRGAAEGLAESYRIYAPDLLGWGQSEMPALSYDGELYIELISDFIEEVLDEKAVLVAAGMSAAYAVQIAVDRPELVDALALITPLGLEAHGDEPDLKDAIVHRLLRLPVLGTSALNLYSSRAALAAYLRREVYYAPALVDDRLVDEHYRSSHQPGAQVALAAYLSGYLNHGVRDHLARLDLPTWICWGRRANHPPVETADLWLRDLDSAELDVLESCGILPHAESPDEVVRKLERFLGGLKEPTARPGATVERD